MKFKEVNQQLQSVAYIFRETGKWSNRRLLLSSSVGCWVFLEERSFKSYKVSWICWYPSVCGCNRSADAQTQVIQRTLNLPQLNLAFRSPERFVFIVFTSFPARQHAGKRASWATQGRAPLSHCKVIRKWAKLQGSSAGSRVWLASTSSLWL